MPSVPSTKNGSVDASTKNENLRLYEFHGVRLLLPKRAGNNEASGTCPFCGSEKFSVNILTTKFKCWSCGTNGNNVSFLKQFWELCYEETSSSQYEKLAQESRLPNPMIIKQFGCAVNLITEDWMVPGYNVEGKLTGLYRFCKIKDKKSDKWVNKLLGTPGMGHHLFNLQNYDPNRPVIDLCEGWRDGIAWQTFLEISNDWADRNVLSVPGVLSFKPQWTKFFAEKEVNILFDNDYPRKNEVTGKDIPPAGRSGVERVASMLVSCDNPPVGINYLAWNGSDDGFSKDLPDGTDIRDYLSGSYH